MAYKRILTIQDISCVGQCSMTVALPILSACGHEVCILPTAVLSTHTGGFGKPEVVHLDAAVEPFLRHWKENEITFDAILVGYIGSVGGLQTVRTLASDFLAPDGLLIVDPAFADHGKIYSGLSREYAEEMKLLCRMADIVLPNLTEAAFFAGCEYCDAPDEMYVKALLDKLSYPCTVLTGIGCREGETGVILQKGQRQVHYCHPRIGKSCHGTGDMFAAAFTGALMQRKTMEESVQIAADFVCRSLVNTMENPAHWYGVKFETALPFLIEKLNL